MGAVTTVVRSGLPSATLSGIRKSLGRRRDVYGACSGATGTDAATRWLRCGGVAPSTTFLLIRPCVAGTGGDGALPFGYGPTAAGIGDRWSLPYP